jgi:hypothetical protein
MKPMIPLIDDQASLIVQAHALNNLLSKEARLDLSLLNGNIT